MSLQPILIGAYSSGLQTDKKPFLLIDSAFQELTNAFVWRERVKKRDGIKLVGRLRRVLTSQAQANADGTSNYDIADILTSFRANEPNAELEKESVVIRVDPGGGNETEFTDQGDGTFSRTSGTAYDVDPGTYIDYISGAIHIEWDAAGTPANGITVEADFNYYPALPCMGISLREVATINVEETVLFDTIYSYTYDGNDFNDISSTTWSGSDSDFFWTTNYRGSTGDVRLFFATNFSVSTSDPIRYYNGTSWTALTPIIADSGGGSEDSMFQARILIPYYGRLLSLNTWEGTTAGGFGGATNFFNRCRFSQIGDPTASDAWESDVFGKGGFIDAPTNESIVSAQFYKDTLIVFFEKSTWALQYVGEYGLPFVWERISSDLGSESTFSTVPFDQGVLAVGDKGIVSSTANQTQRIDEQIPDAVFNFRNQENGKERIQGIRDFQKEIVYWSYSDGGIRNKFPNRVLLYNYRNNTWAIFRDNVTAFGQLTTFTGISWDTDTSWDDPVSWDTIYQGEFPTIIAGNQQGYVHWYQYPADFESTSDSSVNAIENESLSITGITRSATAPLQITVQDHNLEEGDVIYITDLQFIDTSDSSVLTTSMNDSFYEIQNVVDDDTLDLYYWDFSSQSYLSSSGNNLGFTPATGTGTYVGCGQVTLLPKLSIRTKDFNPFQEQGRQLMISYIDFQTDASANASVNVNLVIDSSSNTFGNLIVGSTESETSLVSTGLIIGATQANPCQITSTNHGLKTGDEITILNVKGMTELNNADYTVTFVDLNTFTLDGVDSTAFTVYGSAGNWFQKNPQVYYIPGSQYAWHRFYATVYGQYVSVFITYNDEQMNTLDTHQQLFEMNAMMLWSRPAGRIV